KTLRPGLTAGVVDDHVDTAPAACARLAVHAVDFGHVVLRRRVDHMIGTELLQLRYLPLAARARDHLAANRFAELDAASAHSPARPQDEYLVARLELAAGLDHAERRPIGDREACRLDEGDLARDGQHVFLRHGDKLGRAAAFRLAHHSGRLVRNNDDAITDVPA